MSEINASGLDPLFFPNDLSTGQSTANQWLAEESITEAQTNYVNVGDVISSAHVNELRAGLNNTRAQMFRPGDIPEAVYSGFDLPNYHAHYVENFEYYIIDQTYPVWDEGDKLLIYGIRGTATKSSKNVYEVNVNIWPQESNGIVATDVIKQFTAVDGDDPNAYRYREVDYQLRHLVLRGPVNVPSDLEFSYNYDTEEFAMEKFPGWGETTPYFVKCSNITTQYYEVWPINSYRSDKSSIKGEYPSVTWLPSTPFISQDQWQDNNVTSYVRQRYGIPKPPLCGKVIKKNNGNEVSLALTTGFEPISKKPIRCRGVILDYSDHYTGSIAGDGIVGVIRNSRNRKLSYNYDDYGSTNPKIDSNLPILNVGPYHPGTAWDGKTFKLLVDYVNVKMTLHSNPTP